MILISRVWRFWSDSWSSARRARLTYAGVALAFAALTGVAIVMRERYTLKDWTPGESRHLHIGNHGGTSEDEMLIPLILEET